MLKLKYLELESFRSFKQKTRIDFPSSGLVLIKGKSGAGKTNLFLALSYALDLCPVPATKLKSWFSDKAPQVELGVETEKGLIVIKRGRENSVLGGGHSVTGAKAVAEEISKIAKMDTEMLSAITYRAQRTSGTFVSKGDAEKREFLGALIPLLGRVERGVEQAEAEAKRLATVIDPLQGRLIGLTEATGKMKTSFEEMSLPNDWAERKNSLLKKIEDLTLKRDSLLSAKGELAQKSKEALDLIEKDLRLNALRTEVFKLKELLEFEQKKDREKRTEFETKQKTVHDQISSLTQGLWAASKEIEQEGSLRKQLAALEASVCPVCEQIWLKNETAKVKITDALSKIEKVKANVPAIQEVLTKIRLGVEEWKPNAQLQELSVTIASKQGDLRVASSNAKSEAVLQFKDLQQANELTLQSVLAELKQLVDTVTQEDRKTKETEQRFSQFQKMVSENEAELTKLGQELSLLKRARLLEENVAACLGRNGFLGSIFDQILNEIEVEINKLLLGMTNAQNISVKFRTEAVTQKGTFKKTITPVVYINGHETELASGPSGGQQSAIELVIDLSVLKIVERRTGMSPGWLLQDEVIIGQGPETSVNAIEILKSFAETKLVLVIDHSSEVKEHFQKIIDVRMENGLSYVE